MTRDFFVSATMQMKMVVKVSDRVLTAHCVHLNSYVGGKPLLHTREFFFLLKYSSVILVSGTQHSDLVIHI